MVCIDSIILDVGHRVQSPCPPLRRYFVSRTWTTPPLANGGGLRHFIGALLDFSISIKGLGGGRRSSAKRRQIAAANFAGQTSDPCWTRKKKLLLHTVFEEEIGALEEKVVGGGRVLVGEKS